MFARHLSSSDVASRVVSCWILYWFCPLGKLCQEQVCVRARRTVRIDPSVWSVHSEQCEVVWFLLAHSVKSWLDLSAYLNSVSHFSVHYEQCDILVCSNHDTCLLVIRALCAVRWILSETRTLKAVRTLVV